jgi:predicted NAD/FAD-dependent oxidoreductase
MSTNRCDAAGVNLRADMGAQYLSLDSSNPSSNAVADMLVKAGICADVPDAVLSATPERMRGEAWRHLAGVEGGVNDALKKLLEEAGATPHYEKRVASLDEQQSKWRARPFEGAPSVFDAVIVAVPGCGVGGDNLNKIHGNYQNRLTPEQNRQLLSAQHDARWSFAFYLPSECAKRCDEFFGDGAIEKVVEDSVVHLLCYQSRKTMQVNGSPPSRGVTVVAHSTLEWANYNSRASGRDHRLLAEMSDRVGKLLKLDGSLSRMMLGSKVITWKQSQVTKAIPGPFMLVSSSPAFALAGDYFTDSSFDGCLKSGFAAADAVVKALGSGSAPEAKQPVKQQSQDSADAKSGKGRSDKGDGKGKTGKNRQSSNKSDGQSWTDDSSNKKGKGKGKRGNKDYAWQPYAAG